MRPNRFLRPAIGLLISALLLAACASPGTPPATPLPTATSAPEATPISEITTWDYVVLGETFSASDWPAQYAALLEEDLGVEVVVHNESNVSRPTPTAELLDRLINDQELRDLVSEAEVITVNWSKHDAGSEESLYLNGFCKGEDNQDCLRERYAEIKPMWEAVLDEITSLRSPADALIRTFTTGPWLYETVFGESITAEELAVLTVYYSDMEQFVARSAARRGIPAVDIERALRGPDSGQPIPREFLGANPADLSEKGNALVAQALRELGYEYSTPPAVEVIRALPYTIPAQPTAGEWLLDVYAPPLPGDGPAVVIFHGGGGSRESYGYQVLAQSLAEQGAVVFFPDLAPEQGTDLFFTENGSGLREELEAASCAVRFARAKAAEYGGQPEQVLVIGHSGGGWDGIWLALVGDDVEAVWDAFAEGRGGPPRQMDCVAGEAVSGQPDTLIGFAGAYTYFDQFKADDPELYAVVSPATHVGRNRNTALHLIAAEREFIMPEWLNEANEALYQQLLAAGYDVNWMVADASHAFEAPAREAVLAKFLEVTGP